MDPRLPPGTDPALAHVCPRNRRHGVPAEPAGDVRQQRQRVCPQPSLLLGAGDRLPVPQPGDGTVSRAKPQRVAWALPGTVRREAAQCQASAAVGPPMEYHLA